MAEQKRRAPSVTAEEPTLPGQVLEPVATIPKSATTSALRPLHQLDSPKGEKELDNVNFLKAGPMEGGSHEMARFVEDSEQKKETTKDLFLV